MMSLLKTVPSICTLRGVALLSELHMILEKVDEAGMIKRKVKQEYDILLRPCRMRI